MPDQEERRGSMMPDLLDLLGPSTREPKEVKVEMMESTKIPEERNGKLVDVLLPELLLPLLNERRLVLLRVLAVRSLSISVSDRMSIVGH